MIPVPIIRAFHERGVPVAQIYGATETAPIAIYLRAADCERVGSTGKPAIHCDVKAIDREGVKVADGTQGEILVSGPNVLTCYWRNEPATREALRGGWFILATLDIVTLKVSGSSPTVARTSSFLAVRTSIRPNSKLSCTNASAFWNAR